MNRYPEHHRMVQEFRKSAGRAWDQTLVPITRQMRDRIWEITELVSSEAYTTADTFTRRQMSQELMQRYADEGLTGVRYSNGRTMPLDSYSEMVARTQTKNAFNQANWNRLQEGGIDLTVISVHYPCSDLCEPYQGQVFGISGATGKYPSLQSAIDGGLFHANCKHTSSGYTEGDSLPARDIGTAENREMYAAQQRQRQIERNVRKYKRRGVASLDPSEKARANEFVSKWQAENRKHIKKNPFLRRDYKREKI